MSLQNSKVLIVFMTDGIQQLDVFIRRRLKVLVKTQIDAEFGGLGEAHGDTGPS